MCMSTRTINGKDFVEIGKELLEEIPLTESLQKKPALQIDETTYRLHRIFGILNWSWEKVDGEWKTIRNSKTGEASHAYFFTGRITIRDDSGNIICNMDATGGEDVKFTNTGSVNNFSEVADIAAANALKKAANQLGIGLLQLGKISDTRPIYPVDGIINSKKENQAPQSQAPNKTGRIVLQIIGNPVEKIINNKKICRVFAATSNGEKVVLTGKGKFLETVKKLTLNLLVELEAESSTAGEYEEYIITKFISAKPLQAAS